MSRNTAASRKLYDLAASQGGFFTARQARDAGYADNVHPYHVRSHNWIRAARGVYRLAQFPLHSRPDLMVWQLWSRNRHDEHQGVFSHATALTLYELSDVMPAKLDMTVPPGLRRMAAIPAVLRLHHARLTERDVETADAVRVTTPLRTLLDVIAEGAIAPELQAQAVDQALRRGLVMRRQLETARVSTRARQRIDRVLKQIPDDSSTSVHNRRRASNSARGAGQRTVTTGGCVEYEP
jgi:predicted transcriptional regulator of viral defense system